MFLLQQRWSRWAGGTAALECLPSAAGSPFTTRFCMVLWRNFNVQSMK